MATPECRLIASLDCLMSARWLPSDCLRIEPSALDALGTLQVTPSALPDKAVTLAFYTERPMYAKRTGPTHGNDERLTRLISYDQRRYSNPAFLVTPPLVRTRRGTPSAKCPDGSFGEAVHEDVRTLALDERCQSPYACTEIDLSSPTSLLSCTNMVSPPSHFGRRLTQGSAFFTEFLATLTNTPSLLRNGTNFQTDTFIDQQTAEVEILLLALATEYRIASEIRIKATLGAQITMTSSIAHYTEMRAPDRERIFRLLCIGWIAVLLAVGEVTFRIVQACRIGTVVRSAKATMVLDLLTLVAAPAICLVVVMNATYFDAGGGGDIADKLTSVPWADTDLSWEVKLDEYTKATNELERLVQAHADVQRLLYFASVVLLLRAVTATAVHPRIGVLVNTVIGALDDLGHLLLLVIIVFFGFILIGFAQFGPSSDNFHTVPGAFNSLWEMFVGGVRSGVSITGSAERTTYMLIFLLFVFFLAFNLIIAIVVESFLKVKKEVDDLKADADFITDSVVALQLDTLEKWYRWPSKARAIMALENSAKAYVTPFDIAPLLPDYSYYSILRFFRHYSAKRFPFLAPSENPYSYEEIPLTKVINEVELRLAGMLNREPSTPLARLHSQKNGELSARRAKSLSSQGSVEKFTLQDVDGGLLSDGQAMAMVSDGQVALNDIGTNLSRNLATGLDILGGSSSGRSAPRDGPSMRSSTEREHV